MTYEVIVEGYVLQVEVTYCVNEPARRGTWDSDWDAMGDRELEFKIVSAICYDDDGIRMDVPNWQLPILAKQHYTPITVALWVEIDALKRRERRFAA